jgi:UDP-glucose 4-epimerase
MNSILVTGGAGYIGSHTVVELVKAGYSPIILDNFSNSDKRVLRALNELCGYEVSFIEGSCSDKALLNKIFQEHKISGVIHFAAFKAVGESVNEPLKYYENNVQGTVILLNAMQEAGVDRLIFSSSCTVYGIPEKETVVFETTPLGVPNSPYGWTKFMCEKIIEDTCNAGNIEAVLLRYFNPVGAHPSGKIGELPVGIPNNILPYMTQTAIGLREHLTVFGNDYNTSDGTCIRDYIHVCDLARAHVMALKLDQNNKVEPINLGTGRGTSVLELIHAFEKATSKPLPFVIGPRRSGDVPAIVADVTKAQRVLGWQTELTIEQAINDAWNWEQKRWKDEDLA